MRYYLVAICDNNFSKEIQPIQKNLSRKYKVSQNITNPYIVLETIDDPDIEKLDEVITKLISPYKKFKIELNELICMGTPCKSLNLKIESKGYIKRIDRLVNDTLSIHGFNIKSNSPSSDLYICLANSTISPKYTLAKDCSIIEQSLDCKLMRNTAKIDRLELWKPINNKKESVVKSYPLSSY